MTLDKINVGDIVLINHIDGDNSLKRRLLDLGFVPNSLVKCVLVSPFKDPKAYKIAGNVIALRNSDAKNIGVCYENI